ncbi:MAG: hypothetical protein P0S95_02745 [Rhabdochlamydiaceae bacterium]|nr:hypothetical protein [Candidatus Amphrikana amoebophyrae]
MAASNLVYNVTQSVFEVTGLDMFSTVVQVLPSTDVFVVSLFITTVVDSTSGLISYLHSHHFSNPRDVEHLDCPGLIAMLKATATDDMIARLDEEEGHKKVLRFLINTQNSEETEIGQKWCSGFFTSIWESITKPLTEMKGALSGELAAFPDEAVLSRNVTVLAQEVRDGVVKEAIDTYQFLQNFFI